MILYEDDAIIVCHKQAGIPVQSARIGQKDMVSILNNHLAETNDQPFAPVRKGRRLNQPVEPVRVVHRLDQPVEGVIVFAKTQKAAAGLSRQITSGAVEKAYHAVCCVTGEAEKRFALRANETYELVDFLSGDPRTNTAFAAERTDGNARRAELDFRILDIVCSSNTSDPNCGETVSREHSARWDFAQSSADTLPGTQEYMLAEISLKTGRHHQIRVQMANAGLPLYGDRKYNKYWQDFLLDYGPDRPAGESVSTVPDGHSISLPSCREPLALCAVSLTFRHPTSGQAMNFKVRPQAGIFRLFSRQSGKRSAASQK